MTESAIHHHSNGGTTIVGPDGMRFARAVTIMTSLPLYKIGMQVTRGVTGRKILDMAAEFTGKAYKRGEYDRAKADLKIWVDEMRAALPHTLDGKAV